MAGFTKSKLKKFFFLTIALMFGQCANQMPPGGGEIDTIPPTILEVYPEDGTINYTDDYFEIGFSEYIEKRSFKEAIFISPAIDGDLELDWSGKYVRAYFPNKLKENTTYVITIGTDVEDYNNKNNLAEALTFTFSTGSEIDRRIIAGRIYDEKPQSIMLFCYQLKNADENLLEKKPDYISQSSTDGKFKIAGLSEGSYRVFAVRDDFRDLLYQPEQDEIGFPFRDVVFSETDSLYSGLDFIMTKIDTVKPRLIGATMTDNKHVLVKFSEQVAKQTISVLNFYFYDSTKSERSQVKYAFKGNTKEDEIVLVPNSLLPVDDIIYLFADTLKDKSQNNFYYDFVQVSISDKSDTLKTGVIKTLPVIGSREVDFQTPVITFEFNDAFEAAEARAGISFTDTLNKNIPFEIDFPDDATLNITPLKRLDMSKDYIIKIDLSHFKDAARNYYDSVYKFNFKTISGLEFTGASGKVGSYDELKNPVLLLQSLEKDNLKYSTLILKNGQFNFDRVSAGKYSLFFFYDTDSSGNYSSGEFLPYKKSEEFFFYPDTLNLRARWTETDIKFNLKPR